MLFFKLMIVLFIKMNHAQHGKITGIPTLPHEVLLFEFKPKLEAIKIILVKEVDSMDRQVKLVQRLIQSNSAISKSIASAKIKELKESISNAKEEAKYASSDVKKCINKQEYDHPKKFITPSITCSTNLSDMTSIKNKLSKVQAIMGQLLPNCQKLHMDDTEKDIILFRTCLTERTDDIYRHISRIREEFDMAFENIMRNSLQCSIQGNFDTFRNIGEVMNSLKNCKYVNNFKIQKLP